MLGCTRAWAASGFCSSLHPRKNELPWSSVLDGMAEKYNGNLKTLLLLPGKDFSCRVQWQASFCFFWVCCVLGLRLISASILLQVFEEALQKRSRLTTSFWKADLHNRLFAGGAHILKCWVLG